MKVNLKVVAKNPSFLIGKIEGGQTLRVKSRVLPHLIHKKDIYDVVDFLKLTYKKEAYLKALLKFLNYLKSLEVENAVLRTLENEVDSLKKEERKRKIWSYLKNILFFFLRILRSF